MSRPTAIVTALHNHVFRGDRISLPPTDSLDALMLGANLGLALFDGELRLLACNDLYLSLCGYEPTDVTAGGLAQRPHAQVDGPSGHLRKCS